MRAVLEQPHRDACTAVHRCAQHRRLLLPVHHSSIKGMINAGLSEFCACVIASSTCSWLSHGLTLFAWPPTYLQLCRSKFMRSSNGSVHMQALTEQGHSIRVASGERCGYITHCPLICPTFADSYAVHSPVAAPRGKTLHSSRRWCLSS